MLSTNAHPVEQVCKQSQYQDLPSFTNVDDINQKMRLLHLKCKDYVMLKCSALNK